MGYLECKKIEVYTINQRTKTIMLLSAGCSMNIYDLVRLQLRHLP